MLAREEGCLGFGPAALVSCPAQPLLSRAPFPSHFGFNFSSVYAQRKRRKVLLVESFHCEPLPVLRLQQQPCAAFVLLAAPARPALPRTAIDQVIKLLPD